ncbi:MAG: ATP-binding protein [Polyangiales bacterium]
MNVSSRLTAALSGIALVFFSAVGWWQVRAEERDLRGAAERSMRLLGRSLQVAMENALRDRQPEDIEETVRGLGQIDPSVSIYVFDAGGRIVARSRGAPERALRERTPTTRLRFVREGPRELLVHVVRLDLEQAPDATLMVVGPLDELRADLAAERRSVLVTCVLFVLFVAGCAFLLSRAYVARPLAAMVEAMRRVRAGDLDAATGATQDDEVGAALREFDGLVGELRSARDRLDDELDQRRRQERGLQKVEKLAAVGRLAASVAHEIGSPLQVLEGRASALARRASDDETRRVSTVIVEQARRITRIVSQLMEAARRRSPQRQPVDLAQAVEPIVELLALEARRRAVSLSFERDGAPEVFADHDQVQQVAFNLIRNALQASASGGAVRVSVGRGAVTRAGSGAPVACGTIVVEDRGHGMSEEVRARIFEPFFTTRVDEGTGLGLSIVKGIVDDHLGAVEVTSGTVAGTRFVVSLPCDGLRAAGALGEEGADAAA